MMAMESRSNGSKSWFKPQAPLSASGTSTGGKQAQTRMTLAESRSGNRSGIVMIGDSGAAGAAIERFLSPAGFRKDVSAQEALRLSGFSQADINEMTAGLTSNAPAGKDPGFYNVNPDGTLKMGKPAWYPDQPYGWPVAVSPVKSIGAITRETPNSIGGEEDLWGNPTYIHALTNTDTVQGTNITFGSVDNSRMTGSRARYVRGFAPYFEDFHHHPASNAGNVIPGTRMPNSFLPFVAWRNPGHNDFFAGIQNLIQARNENEASMAWQNRTFYQFNDLHDGLNLDGVITQPTRGKEGYACTIPYDHYFLNFLMAPHGMVMIAASAAQMRTNQPSMEANWLLTDEIYKFYGEQEYMEANGQTTLTTLDGDYPPEAGLYMGWDKYIWNNQKDFWWGVHAGLQAIAVPTIRELRSRYLSGQGTTTANAKAQVALMRNRDPYYVHDDPVLYIGDYQKMDWGRPGHPTIAERMGKRVKPIMPAYFLGEVYHQAPSQATTPPYTYETYHNAAKAQYPNHAAPNGTPASGGLPGPRFKPLDWRGLTDEPENM